MNGPSFDKFIDKVVPGGIVLADSSLISQKTTRTDITVVYIPATVMANENDLVGGANVIMLGQLMKVSKLFDFDFFVDCVVGDTAKKKPKLAENNKKALTLGYNF
jgi:2-oxoglutarate ferredoxin oxidoreductase subunit gamma